MTGTGKADYIVTGQFSKKAAKEAAKYGDAKVGRLLRGRELHLYPAPDETTIFRPDADYVHICFNNTIYGTKWNYIPDTGDIPLVADMSSCILSEPVDVTQLRRYLCRRAEEHGTRRSDRRYRPRGSARALPVPTPPQCSTGS